MNHRVERHLIKNNHYLYNTFKEYSLKVKELYNYTNNYITKCFLNHEKALSCYQFSTREKNSLEYKMIHSKIAQSTIGLVFQNWNSYYEAMASFKKNPSDFDGKPEIPKNKDDGCVIILNNQCAVHKNTYIQFPKCFNKFKLKTKISSDNYSETRIVQKSNCFIIDVAYEVVEPKVKNTGRILSVDFGVNNLFAVVNNFGERPIIINGRPLKSINQYFNKKLAELKSGLPKRIYTSNKIEKLCSKRNRKIEDYLHKATTKLIEYANENNCDTIIIGYNKRIKKKVKLGAVNNQNFVYIPWFTIIKKLKYKCEDYGIKLVVTEESNTSGTSFIDGELPTEEFYNKKRRIKRGMFIANNGMSINADINGAFQIMNKVAHYKWVEGLVLDPIKINIF